MKTNACLRFIPIMILFSAPVQADPLGTAFTYQGRLQDGTNAATGLYDLRFLLYDSETGGIPVGAQFTTNGVPVTNGLFTVTLDFGQNVFDGSARWLDTAVRTNGRNLFIALPPREPLTAAPYSLWSAAAGTAATVKSGAITADALAAGAVTGAALAPGQLIRSLNGLRDDVALLPGNNISFLTNFNTLTISATAAGSGGGWSLAGNSGTSAGANFLGTIDSQPLLFKVNSQPALTLSTGGSLGMGTCTNLADSSIAFGSYATAAGQGSAAIGYRAVAGGISGLAFGDHATAAGNYSLAAGVYATASGMSATAIGNACQAGQSSAVAIGTNALAGGIGALAFGDHASALGDHSLAAGLFANATGDSAAAIGNACQALNSCATALGTNAVASGIASTALGSKTTASGKFGTAIGNQTVASGFSSVASGSQTTASGFTSFAAGNSTKATGYGCVALGWYASATNDYCFVWGDGSDPWGLTSSADHQFVIYALGGVGIGGPPGGDSLLDVRGNCRINDHDVFLRSAPDKNHGLGWYGGSRSFASTTIDGPILYGASGGALGVRNNGESLAMAWDGNGNVVVDPNGKNNGFKGGTHLNYSLAFGASSGEGIASQRVGSDNPFGLDFFTDFQSRMKIENNGNVVIQGSGAGSGGGRLGIGGDPGNWALMVDGEAAKTTGGMWMIGSDARIKTDVVTVANSLETLDKVRLVSFRYTDSYRAAHPTIEDHVYLNVIAQEFQEVFPDFVKRSGEKLADGSDMLQVDPYPITVYSAAAIQELHRKVEDQAAELRAKEARILALEQGLERLEARLGNP